MRETIIEPRAMTRFGNAVDEAAGAHRGRTLLTERHQHIILWHVLNPNAPAISQCVREVQRKFQAEGMFVPSDPTIRRFAKAYMTECFDSWTAFREGEKAWNDRCSIMEERDARNYH